MHRLYETENISVFWDSDKCRHAKKCVTGCPEAFDIQRKPWIQLDKAETAKVWKAVSNCPSGALTCVFNHGIIVIWCPGGYGIPYSSPKTMAKGNREKVSYIRKGCGKKRRVRFRLCLSVR